MLEKYSKVIESYIDTIMSDSTPDRPVWNKEYIDKGRKPQWNYIDGCMMTALYNIYETTGDEKYYKFFENFLDYYVAEDGSILGYSVEEYNIDNVSEGRVLFDAYKKSKKEKYKKAADLIYSQVKTHPRTKDNSFWHKKIYPNQVWLDGLYMCQVFYSRYETEFNNKKNYDDIILQFKNVEKFMFDNKKQLYYHGFDSSKQMFWSDKDTGCSKSFWLRSLGWFCVALVDVLTYIDSSSKQHYDYLKQLIVKTLDGVLQYQDKNTGMFWQVVDKPNKNKNYLETSGSAMISYALLKASTLVDKTNYYESGKKCFLGICDNYLQQDNGKLHLGGICLVAGLGPEDNKKRDGSYEYYVSEPIVKDDAKGLGPFILAYSQLKKIAKN